MTFEDLIVKDVPQLPEGHPAHYLEKLIKGNLLKKKAVHDAEHGDMLEHWGMDRDVDYATVLSSRDGQADRFWHICMHLRYWKEKGMHTEHVEEFESKFPQVDLSNIPLPKL